MDTDKGGNAGWADANSERDGGNERRGGYNGPCVIYLSPDGESRRRLSALRERLRAELFPGYDPFSPSSSVSPYPEQLPRKRAKSPAGAAGRGGPPTKWRPLLLIARFPSVEQAVKIARVLQQSWDPLTFNVTDLQFVSRSDDGGAFPGDGA